MLRADETFTIVAVNERYLGASGTERSAIMGRGLFGVFADNPDDRNGTEHQRPSHFARERVKRERAVDVMGVQKYDIPVRLRGQIRGQVLEPGKHAVAMRKARFGTSSPHVEDVTHFILSRERALKERGKQ